MTDYREPISATRWPRTERYSTVAIILHWIIAACIIFNLAIGYFMEGFPPALRGIAVPLHISAGLTVLVLTAVRILWRLTHEPPAYPANMHAWERHSAHIVHFLLYCGMVLMPLTGWMIVSAHPTPGSPGAAYAAELKAKEAAAKGLPAMPAPPKPAGGKAPKGGGGGTKLWWVIPWPALGPVRHIGDEPGGVPAQNALHEDFVDWHGTGGYIMILLLILHIGGALKHQIIDKQAEFARMGIGKAEEA